MQMLLQSSGFIVRRVPGLRGNKSFLSIRSGFQTIQNSWRPHTNMQLRNIPRLVCSQEKMSSKREFGRFCLINRSSYPSWHFYLVCGDWHTWSHCKVWLLLYTHRRTRQTLDIHLCLEVLTCSAREGRYTCFRCKNVFTHTPLRAG